MSRVPWHLFKDRQPRAHLVAAVLRAAPTATDPDPREAQGVLVRLVRMLGILILIGALPTWPYSSSWGYYPSGGAGLILIVVVVLVLTGRF
jgi:hypothetical protein